MSIQIKISPLRRIKMIRQLGDLLDKNLVLPHHTQIMMALKTALEEGAPTVDANAAVIFAATKSASRGAYLRGVGGPQSLRAKERWRKIKEKKNDEARNREKT